ncbi:RimK family alpha-L-glutamate ligase [Streptomyces sp. NPDC057257]|uniref:ATP-grasp domain-containing protein n=1 Tax=Streptomyces sp. NPDC057257 TaxID=3346071 RepID=UPI003632E116
MGESVWLLDRIQSDWEVDTLCAALNDRGIPAERVDWAEIQPYAVPPGFAGPQGLREAPRLAVVTARVLTRHTEGDLALLYDWLAMLEDQGARLVNPVGSLRVCQNKVRQAARLAAADLPVPPTRAVRSAEEVERCLADWGDVIVKPITGHASVDVIRLVPGGGGGQRGSLLGLREDIVLWHWLRRHHVLCAQRFVENPGRDLRAAVIGGRVASCHYHVSTAPDGSVRSLLHPLQWAPAELTDELERILVKCLEVLGLDLATIDLVEGPDGPVVIEVNPTVSRWEPVEGTDLDLTPHGITAAQVDLLTGLLRP